MNRRTFIYSTGALASANFIGKMGIPLDFLAYEMKTIRGNVGYFTERGGTIGWLIQNDLVVIIDSQFQDQAKNLISELDKRNATPIRYLINTHHHRDHTSGNIAFKGIAKNVLAHENSRINQMNAARSDGSEAQQLYPDIVFTERWQEKCGDETIDIQYWGPAHTNGDSIIHFQQANVVHCGDLVFNRRYPFIDKTAGARIDNWIEILTQMQAYFDNDAVFIFGHAREGFPVVGTKDDLAAFAGYLTALLEFVDRELKAGKSREQIMAATSIPGAPEWKGDGIERSLKAALEELEG